MWKFWSQEFVIYLAMANYTVRDPKPFFRFYTLHITSGRPIICGMSDYRDRYSKLVDNQYRPFLLDINTDIIW